MKTKNHFRFILLIAIMLTNFNFTKGEFKSSFFQLESLKSKSYSKTILLCDSIEKNKNIQFGDEVLSQITKAEIFFLTKKIVNGIGIYKSLLKNDKVINSSVEQGLIFNSMGKSFSEIHNLDTAQFFLIKAKEIFENKKNNIYLFETRINYINSLISLKKLSKAEDEYKIAYKENLLFKNNFYKAKLDLILSDIFYAQSLYKNSEKILLSLISNRKLENNNLFATCNLKLGNIYYMQMKDSQSNLSYNKALNYFTQLCDSMGIAISLSNLSRLNLDVGNKKVALIFARKALKIVDKSGYDNIEAATLQQLGDIYGELDSNIKAINTFKSALLIAQRINSKLVVKDCYKSLSENYYYLNNPKFAYDYLLKAYRIKDSIQPILYNNKLAEMESLLKTEQKEEQIRLLEIKNIKEKLEIEKQKNKVKKFEFYLFIIVIISLFIFIITYLYISNQRIIQKIKNDNIKKETQEEERVRISRDIHDEIGAGLSKIKFLTRDLSKDDLELKTRKSLDGISYLSNNLIENIGELVWALNPENLYLESLVIRIREYTYDYLEEFDIENEIICADEIPMQAISIEVFRNTFMIIKEILQNIVKHSMTKKVIVEIKIDSELRIRIQDFGIGFNFEKIIAGNGLKNIKQRSALIPNSEFSIKSEVGKGMIFEIQIVI